MALAHALRDLPCHRDLLGGGVLDEPQALISTADPKPTRINRDMGCMSPSITET
jgi:hypothetical protein